jgi:hypothetical protein
MRSDFRKGVRGRMKCSPAVPLLTKGDEQGVRKRLFSQAMPHAIQAIATFQNRDSSLHVQFLLDKTSYRSG